MKMWWLCLVLLLGCGKPAETPVPVAEKPVGPLTGTASITGKIVYRGDTPRTGVIKMAADPYCESAHSGTVSSEELLVNPDHTLRNVFVYVKQGLEGRQYPAPGQPAVLTQSGCMYRPRVQGLLTGQTLIIRNDDDTLHNVHALGEQNPAFNLGQPARGMESKKVFLDPEVMLRFKCDVHPWMTAYIGILPHPFYAVTGEAGTFALTNLPAGNYAVEAWHEKLGTQTATVQLADGEAKTVEFSFNP